MAEAKSRGHVVINTEECKGCELCINACPPNVLYLSDTFNTHGYHPSVYKGDGCTGCGVCFYACPEPGAITVFKRWDLLTEVGRCENCGEEHKIFTSEKHPGDLFCTKCLKPIGKSEKEVLVK